MRIAHLAIGERNFYLDPDEADHVLAAVKVARERAEWLTVSDVGGKRVRLLIPAETLLVFREYEVADVDTDTPDEPDIGWVDLDF